MQNMLKGKKKTFSKETVADLMLPIFTSEQIQVLGHSSVESGKEETDGLEYEIRSRVATNNNTRIEMKLEWQRLFWKHSPKDVFIMSINN